MNALLSLLVLVVSFVSCAGQEPEPTAQTVQVNPRQELGSLKMQRDKVRLNLSRLEADKQEIVSRIVASGIDVDNLSQHSDWRLHARELNGIVGQIEQLSKIQAAYNQAIDRMELLLREEDRAARMQNASLTEEDLNELSRISHELAERLQEEEWTGDAETIQLEQVLIDALNEPLDGEKNMGGNLKFVFKVRTASGGIVGNILIEASDEYAAVNKLMQRYPGCQILEGGLR